jgi:hypothetical protein
MEASVLCFVEPGYDNPQFPLPRIFLQLFIWVLCSWPELWCYGSHPCALNVFDIMLEELCQLLLEYGWLQGEAGLVLRRRIKGLEFF